MFDYEKQNLVDKLVFTDYMVGLQKSDVEKAISILVDDIGR